MVEYDKIKDKECIHACFGLQCLSGLTPQLHLTEENAVPVYNVTRIRLSE